MKKNKKENKRVDGSALILNKLIDYISNKKSDLENYLYFEQDDNKHRILVSTIQLRLYLSIIKQIKNIYLELTTPLDDVCELFDDTVKSKRDLKRNYIG